MLTEQSIRLPNGAALRYVEQGPTGAVPPILLHGFPDSWLSYETVLANLPSTIHAIALSQRGFGNSDKPEGGYHPRDLAADLADFMTLCRIPRAILAGHSMGALVAQSFAVAFPERIAGLVLIGTFKGQHDNEELAAVIDEVARMSDPIDLDLVRAFQASTLAQPVQDEFFRTVVAEGARLPLAIWRAALKDIAAYDDFAALSKISAPTILFWGEGDGFSTYEQQQELASEIPGAELRVYAGAGHSLHWEEPRRLAADVANFVRALEWIRAVRHPLKSWVTA
jgi:non-heme chloroperoxidase